MRRQLRGVGGFRQVIIDSRFEAFDLVVYHRLCSEHHDWDVRERGVGSKSLGHLIPIHIGHHDVQQN